jgi:hypothetical protein
MEGTNNNGLWYEFCGQRVWKVANVWKNDSNNSDKRRTFQAPRKVTYKQGLMLVSEFETLSLCLWLYHLIVKHPEPISIKL